MSNDIIHLEEGQAIEYDGQTVGHARRMNGAWVFDWAQQPFEAFCTPLKDAFGMGEGLVSKLEDSPFMMVLVGNDQFVSVSELRDYEFVEPYHEVFNTPPDEGQYIIRVDY